MSIKILKVIPIVLLVSIIYCAVSPGFLPASAESSADTTFQVNVRESLSVSITTPTTWISGDIDTFLRNTVGLTVSLNNSAGFTASMSAQSSNSLVHSSKSDITISTMSSSTTRANFPTNAWGYSLRDSVSGDDTAYNETDAGNPNSNYYPVGIGNPPTPILVNSTNGTASQNIYFGAKANISKASGTYSGTVIINVVSGVISNDNPISPVNPAENNNTDSPIQEQVDNAYRIVYPTTTTTNASSGTTTTTTTIAEYVPPQGTTYNTSSNVYEGSMLTTALAVTASVAATSGTIFFILAKRKEDEEDDEEETV